MAVGLHHGQAEAEDKNDAQEQLDEPLQLQQSHGEVEGEDHNNALEQEEDEGEDVDHQHRLPREP
ncbi:hypothetical protein E2C01_065129 [Portunus trituberculatus]|uniref:Uncharacterized protein n=1 Tax=Portunus trituberculatus TaxID=210409 RepID=A0A5B7HNS2_PORTR|nr:hypothetical protein [Portunus trituberculatus]